MAISNLSSSEISNLSKRISELDSIIKQKELLDAKMTPLCDKLSELEDEEEKINIEYDNIFSISKEAFTSDQTTRLVDIIGRLKEISDEKSDIKNQIANLSNEFFNVRKEEELIRENINEISSNKKGSIFSNSNDVVVLDEKGNIVNSVVVNNSDFSKISTQDYTVDTTKNTITKTNNAVINVIKNNFKKVKNYSCSLKENLSSKVTTFIQNIGGIASELAQEMKNGYAEEEERVQNIINNYKKIKEETKKAEEEAENLQFADSTATNEEKPQVEIDNQDEVQAKKEKVDEIPVDNVAEEETNEISVDNAEEKEEVKKQEKPEVEINLDDVVNVVENNSPQDTKVEENISNIFGNISIDNDSEEINNEEVNSVEPYYKSDHLANDKSNKIAKSNVSKLANMLNLFKEGAKLPSLSYLFENSKKLVSNIGKSIESISTNKELKNAKREAIQELNNDYTNKQEDIINEYKESRDKLEELKKQKIEEAQQSYNNDLGQIENIFSGNSLAA